jgi:hypothetical protein
MAERYRLRRLHMSQSGHDGARMIERLFSNRALIKRQRSINRVYRVAHPQSEIGRNLIVARARGMQPSRCLADQFRQAAFHVHMDVFERALEGKLARLDL